ncbi:MAG TPA: hypothetical protein PKM88_15360 [bacterium]|nr:hypothetical protein [bacterium]
MLGKLGVIAPQQTFVGNMAQYQSKSGSASLEQATPNPNPAGNSAIADQALPSKLNLGLGEQVDISA